MKKVASIIITLLLLAALVVSGLIAWEDAGQRQQIRVLEQALKDSRAQAGKLTTCIDELTTLKREYTSLELTSKYQLVTIDARDKEIAWLRGQLEEYRVQLRGLGRWGDKELSNFTSMPELLRFLADVNLLALDWEAGNWDCDDFTFLLMRLAADRGKAIYPVIIFSLWGTEVVSVHTMNFAIVHMTLPELGELDAIVAIEPQTLETIFIGRVDDKASWKKQFLPYLPQPTIK